MTNSAHFSFKALVFNGKQAPEEGTIVGYAAIIEKLGLPIPMPYQTCLISSHNKRYNDSDWNVFPFSYMPNDTVAIPIITSLYNHLVFALKYEGVNLLVFKYLTKCYSEDKLTELVNHEPTGQYSRRIWFLLEWISNKELPKKQNLVKKSYIPLLKESIHCTINGIKSPRHLVINNLPGNRDFCPLVFKTEKIKKYLSANLADKNKRYVKTLHKDLLQRASAFLLLKDSKASFTIEGESPKSKRAARWGQAIRQAGTRVLSKEELLRLQQLVIESKRFTKMGFRRQGGFVGDHDRISGAPIPDHISAQWQDVEQLTGGLISAGKLLEDSDFDAIMAAAIIAFGFVIIHPFVDGNGRIHRYLIHHILAKKKFSEQGIIFPVSASILNRIDEYRKVLQSYSHPILDFIEWKETRDHNIEVLNETIDYYRYFDASKFAEFLFDCVDDTIENIIPEEINYLLKYDEFIHYIDNEFEMPDKMVADLLRFLEQNNGKLSKAKKDKFFPALTDKEVQNIETQFDLIFQ
jgi:hypothetical protein